VQDVESKYYANGEDAYEMRKYFGAGNKRRGGRGSSGGGKSAVATERRGLVAGEEVGSSQEQGVGVGQ
ncbi:hypothetical protein MNEG_0075, partial [Monoraphidium neglectum]|jgi:hypothetical protein